MPESSLEGVKALTFDIFGTVVDWRSSVVSALQSAAASKTSSTPEFHQKLHSIDWGEFAQQWHTSYMKFTRGFVPGETPWIDIDTHHRNSLLELLSEWDLHGVFTPEETEKLSKTWHFLNPWEDSSEGLQKLGLKYTTATLSNGNTSLLKDLIEFGNLGFKRILSAEDFKAYKPNPEVYLGAARELGLEPGQVAMVAAHLGDLAAARKVGLKTVYVERPREEDWKPDEERYRDEKKWVDIWVSDGEGGLMEVTRRLGLCPH